MLKDTQLTIDSEFQVITNEFQATIPELQYSENEIT